MGSRLRDNNEFNATICESPENRHYLAAARMKRIRDPHLIRLLDYVERRPLKLRDPAHMLPPEVLSLLREWWKARPARYDADVPVRERWLFPGPRLGKHLTTRQLSRLFHKTTTAAGITKPVHRYIYLRSPFAFLSLSALQRRKAQPSHYLRRQAVPRLPGALRRMQTSTNN